MPTSPTDVAKLIGLVRLAFHRLRAAGDAMHGRRGISSAMRGVLEGLVRGGPQTVPRMAAARPVSRQHVQALVDELAAMSLVETLPNPRHKRSPLVAVTPVGRQAFAEMLAAEVPVLEAVARELDAADVAAAMRVLAALVGRLDPSAPPKEQDHD